MRLPSLSPATRRIGRATAFARRGAVHPSDGVCNIPCGPGFLCPIGCTCECNTTAANLTYDPKHLGFQASHVGCMCVGRGSSGGIAKP
jgi:hypothetical protein